MSKIKVNNINIAVLICITFLIFVSSCTSEVYTYQTEEFKEKLVLHKKNEKEGTFVYTKYFTEHTSDTYAIISNIGNVNWVRPIYNEGTYTILSDSSIFLNDTINSLRRMSVIEDRKQENDDNSITIFHANSVWYGARFIHDVYDISNPSDTILILEGGGPLYKINKGVKKIFIRLRKETASKHAPYDKLTNEITFPDYEIKNDSINQLIITSQAYPIIDNEIWKITKTGIVPLSTDCRTYVNYVLKRNK